MFQNFILHLFEHKGMLISSHNLHYIWICQEKQKINFSKIAFFKGLEKKCFCKPLAKLYTPSTLNIDSIQWHTQLIVRAVKC